MSEEGALQALLAHHLALAGEASRKVADLRLAVASGQPYEEAAGEIVAFFTEEVAPHAAAEEHTVFRVAGTRFVLAPTVRKMTSEHRDLAALTEALAGASSGLEALEVAERLSAALADHLDKENEALLARLKDEGRTSMAELLADVRYATNRLRSQPA